MNIYDLAHQLAKALRQSDEARALVALRETVHQEPEAKKMLDDFQSKQWEFERKRMMGESTPEEEEQLRKLHDVIQLHHGVRDYLNAEYRLSIVLSDIQRIIGEAVNDVAGITALNEKTADE